jgi:acetyl-CoA C-acetyltransferase
LAKEIVIIDGCRSPIGDFGGAFKDFMPSDLAVPVVQALMEKTGVDKALVEEIILGHCIQRTDDANTARVVALKAGFPYETTGVTVQRQCSSAMQAIIQGYHELYHGDVEMVVAGGVEVMSSSPYLLKSARWGQRLQHGGMSDTVWEVLTDPVVNIMMGETAENLAEKYGITREEQDEVAYQSHSKAINAIKEGIFSKEIVPIHVPRGKKSPLIVNKDEHPREDVSVEKLSQLPAIFRKSGTVTAGNASGINDGAAAVLMTTAERANQLGLKPMGKILSFAWAGVEPELMGYGPVPATIKALQRAGLTIDDIGLIEVNEAFAAQYLTCEKILGLNRLITNVNGSGIGLGHPIGCTGTRIVVTLLHEMARRNIRYGLATLCVGGGIGVSLIVERI